MKEYWYRYDYLFYEDGHVLINLEKYEVVKHTPKGVWILIRFALSSCTFFRRYAVKLNFPSVLIQSTYECFAVSAANATANNVFPDPDWPEMCTKPDSPSNFTDESSCCFNGLTLTLLQFNCTFRGFYYC